MIPELEDALVLVATLGEEDQRQVAENIRIALLNIEERDTMTPAQRRKLFERRNEERVARLKAIVKRWGNY